MIPEHVYSSDYSAPVRCDDSRTDYCKLILSPHCQISSLNCKQLY